MKITLLSTAYPYRGGIAVFTERLARAFQASGDTTNILTFKMQYPSFLFPGKSQYSTDERPGTISRIVRSNKHTKVLVVVDNIFPHERRLGDKILNKYFINSVHGFITMSKQVLSDLRYFDNLKPAINAVHPLYDNFGDIQSKLQARNNLNLNQEDNYVLFFGIIRKYKGYFYFS